MFGTVLGIIRFITEYVYPAPDCGKEDDRPGFVSLNFMYFGESSLFKTLLFFSAFLSEI